MLKELFFATLFLLVCATRDALSDDATLQSDDAALQSDAASQELGDHVIRVKKKKSKSSDQAQGEQSQIRKNLSNVV
jgi:hypothetical protein